MVEYQYLPGGKQTIVFLPALGFDYTYWKKSSSYFNAKGYATLAVTLRGHAAVRTTLRHISLQDHVQDLQEIVSFLQIKNPVVVGASLGGSVAATYNRTYPNQIEKCICINTPFTINDIYTYIRLGIEIIHPIVFLDYMTRTSTTNFSTSKHTNYFLMSLQYILKFNTFGLYLNYLCVKRMGTISHQGAVTIDVTDDEVIKKRAEHDFRIEGNHNVVISRNEAVNMLIEKIIHDI